jgi:hypothetical protein
MENGNDKKKKKLNHRSIGGFPRAHLPSSRAFAVFDYPIVQPGHKVKKGSNNPIFFYFSASLDWRMQSHPSVSLCLEGYVTSSRFIDLTTFCISYV